MKRMMIALIWLVGSTLPGLAQGIQFDKIAKGTQFYYEGSDGHPSYVTVYTGFSKGTHEMRHYFVSLGKVDAEPFWTDRFDPQGRLVERRKKAFDILVRFVPFNCEYAPAGPCSHEHRLLDAKTGEKKSVQRRDFFVQHRGATLRYYRGKTADGRLMLVRKRDDKGISLRRDEYLVRKKSTARLKAVTTP